MKNNNSMINTNNNVNNISVVPIISYSNADLYKKDIKDNKEKTGVYRWTHVESGKSYVGSAIDLSRRLKNYYNISYLEREIEKNNSVIYKGLLKYGYSSFKLDILEYYKPSVLIEREQYYLDLLKPTYNILKFAGSVAGLKHTEASIELIRASNLGHNRTEQVKLKIPAGSAQAQSVFVTDNKTGETKEFTSVRKAAEYVGLHHSYVAKCLQKQNIYKGKEYTIVKKK